MIHPDLSSFLRSFSYTSMTFFCLAIILLSPQNLSLSSDTLFMHLSMTKKSRILHLCQCKLNHTRNYCTSLQWSLLSWLKPEQLDLKHTITLLNNTLLNNQQSPLTNLTIFLHLELFAKSLKNLIHTNRILLTTLTHNLECYDHTLKIL